MPAVFSPTVEAKVRRASHKLYVIVWRKDMQGVRVTNVM